MNVQRFKDDMLQYILFGLNQGKVAFWKLIVEITKLAEMMHQFLQKLCQGYTRNESHNFSQPASQLILEYG